MALQDDTCPQGLKLPAIITIRSLLSTLCYPNPELSIVLRSIFCPEIHQQGTGCRSSTQTTATLSLGPLLCPAAPLQDRALQAGIADCYEQGLVRAIGVSNYGASQKVGPRHCPIFHLAYK
eukprot:scaffold238368_cov22-Tisochrysis_lutea.AAC.1